MRVSVEGLGPHRFASADLAGIIRRPSEWGKSWLVDAALWAVLGRDRADGTIDPAAIRVDAPASRGSRRGKAVATFKDRMVERTITDRGTVSIALDGERIGSDKDLSTALGLPDRSVSLLVAAPMYWRRLGEQAPRKLRDALVAALCDDAGIAAVVRREVADYDPEADGGDEKQAVAKRRDLNRALAQADGAATETRRAYESHLGRQPVAPEYTEDDVARSEAWHEATKAHRAAWLRREQWVAATADLAGVPVLPVDEARARLEAARQELADARAAVMRVEDDPELVAEVERLRAEWTKVSDALASLRAPVLDTDGIDKANGAAVAAERESDAATMRHASALSRAGQSVRDAIAHYDRAIAARDEHLAHAKAPGLIECPECHHEFVAPGQDDPAPVAAMLDRKVEEARGVVEAAKAELARLQAAGDEVEAGARRLLNQAAEHRAKAARIREAFRIENGKYEERVAELRAERDRLAGAGHEAKAAVNERRAAGEGAAKSARDARIADAEAALARAELVMRSSELGPEPEAPGARPETPPNHVLEPATARRMLAQHQALADEWQVHLSRLTGEVARAEAAQRKAQAAAERADRIVEAVRAAPSTLLREQLDRVNARLDGEALVVDDDGARLVVDGRPLHLASTGRQIVADCRLRLALDDALGVTGWPVVVDDASLWSGSWPADPRVVLLLTERGDAAPTTGPEPMTWAAAVEAEAEAIAVERAAVAVAEQPAPKASGAVEWCTIDFETAGKERHTACAVAVVRWRGTEPVESFVRLVHPPVEEIMHSDVHGMTWNDLRDAPAWDDVWPGVAKMLDGAAFVVAHNAAFDRGVLAACNAFAGIETPPMVWRCSKEAAWRHNGKRTGGKLSEMCAEFGIELNHHDPLSDAMACGRLMIALGGAS